MMNETQIDALFDDKDQLARIRNEAVFGKREIATTLAALPDGAHVLEIGSGTGYLIATLAREYPNLNFEGVEPVGAGFQEFEEALSRLEEALPNLTIHRARIEDMTPSRMRANANFIFSVNVFEHLEDWRSGLDKAVELLAPSGHGIILCPNYAFPYESHFKVPVLGSANLTRRVFAKRIERIENDLQAEGLWSSINFITVPAVAAHARKQGFDVDFDKGILARMLARLDTDAEFAKRQSALAPIARLANKLGAGWLSARMPATLSPYLCAHIRAGSSSLARSAP